MPADSGFDVAAAVQRSDVDASRALGMLRRAAWCLAALIALLLPAAQLGFGLQSLQAQLEIEAAQLADNLSRRVVRNPDAWLYELNNIAAELHQVRSRHDVWSVRLLDEKGREVAAEGDWATAASLMSQAEVFDSGIRVAAVQLQSSVEPVVRAAAKVALAGLLLALATWWLIAKVAIRSVEQLIQRLQQVRSEAEAANRAKSAFLAAMSHEIRTPMNGVLGMAELLAHSDLDEEQTQTVHTVRESAGSLLRIIDDILDFSKIEAGRLELESELVELTPLVEGVCDALAPLASAREVRLAVCLEPDVTERVIGDGTRLRQVLYNLVGNAIKFSSRAQGSAGSTQDSLIPAGRAQGQGVVSVRVRKVGDQLHFTVTDNGIGIDAATRARLFTPFTQAEVSTTRRFGGTGLGLTICRRLVQLMGGRIEVRSQPGRGSTFSVWLPCVAAAEQPVRLTPDLSGMHCLLLDDAALPLPDLQRWLRGAGAAVHAVASMPAALALAAGLSGPVVLIREDDAAGQRSGDDDDARSGPGDGSALGELRQLLLGRGRRGPARIVSPTVVTLDLLRQAPFLRAVATLAGRASPEVAAPPADALLGRRVAPPSVAQARERGQLILVAEDDATNRSVILRQLALLGFAAEVAVDGEQALAMWQQGGYALLLTDLHMPGIDGYSLVQALRATERAQGQSRTPMLALTANALKGEAARARTAGMDDYLTKPVPLKLLQAALKQWLPAPQPHVDTGAQTDVQAGRQTSVQTGAQTSADPGVPDLAVLDLAVLRALVGNHDAVVHELVADFAEQARVQAAELVRCMQRGDAPAAVALAHKLKSASRSVGALTLGDLCAHIESTVAKCSAESRLALALALQQAAAAATAAAQRACGVGAGTVAGHAGPAGQAGQAPVSDAVPQVALTASLK